MINQSVRQSVKGAFDELGLTLALSTESRDGRLTIYIYISIILA